MIKACHNAFLLMFFKFYTIWKIKKTFAAFNVTGNYKPSSSPILLISNHTSWWDGFWAYYLNLKIFKKKFHFMMLKSQLEKFWFFKHTGGFSIQHKSKDLITSLEYTISLLKEKNNLVLIFPQGEINSIHEHKFKFKKGINKISSSVGNNVQILMLVFFIDYFSAQKPTVFSYFKELNFDNANAQSIEQTYQEFYDTCLKTQIKRK